LFPKNLVIEGRSRGLDKSGADSELLYLFVSIRKVATPTIVLMDGWSPLVRDSLKERLDSKGPVIAVYTMAEFHRAVKDGFLG
jgi:hypothetical protein